MKLLVVTLALFLANNSFGAERKCGWAPRNDRTRTHVFIDNDQQQWTVLNITLVSDKNYCITGVFNYRDQSLVSQYAEPNATE
jgi:hypothetical protein